LVNRRALRWFATVWVICLIVASLQPYRPEATRGHHSYKHQIEHVVVFGATGIIFLALARNRREDWTAVGGVIVLGLFIETAQFLIYRMPEGFEWWDVREDTVGALIAFAIITRLKPRVPYFQSAVKTLNS
jgi:VanZ family protein